MKIAVAGGGVAGSYLACLLNGIHEITVFERQKREGFKPICAWGASKPEMRRLSDRIGMNFDEYIFHEGREMVVKLPRGAEFSIKLKGLCTFDKKSFILDMHNRVKVHYGVDAKSLNLSEYSLVVDSTGFHRALLPRLKHDYFIPTVEYLVKYNEPPFDDFVLMPMTRLGGYLWYFPLKKGLVHVGVGDLFGRHTKSLREFIQKYPGEVLDVMGKPVRIAPPHLSLPILNNNVVGLGESIGTVHPVIGEGIIPSMQCAEILAECIDDSLERYPREVLKHFSVFFDIFKFIKKAHNMTFSYFKDFKLLLSPFIYMKMREERFGMVVKLRDWMRIVNAYRVGSLD